MKRPFLVVAALTIAGCASSAGKVSDLGGGAYAMTKRSGLASQRSTELKLDLEIEALKLCADRGQALAMLDTRGTDEAPPDFSSATIQFRCVAR